MNNSIYELSILRGKKVKHAIISDKHDVMLWQIDDSWYKMTARMIATEGGNSYKFSQCFRPHLLFSHSINKIEVVNLRNKWDGYVQRLYTQFKFDTRKGFCTLELETTSRDYYHASEIEFRQLCSAQYLHRYVDMLAYQRLEAF